MTKHDPSDNRITVRVPPDLLSRLKTTLDKRRDPYAPTMTAIVLRGLDLALRERKRR